MGMSCFGTIEVGKYSNAREAYHAAREQATNQYGTDPYNGTIATTSGVVDATVEAPRYGTKAFRAWENARLDRLQKFGNCVAIEIKGAALKELKKSYGLKAKRGIKAFYFFGWAAE